MPSQRQRKWLSIETTYGGCFTFAGVVEFQTIKKLVEGLKQVDRQILCTLDRIDVYTYVCIVYVTLLGSSTKHHMVSSFQF